MLVAVTGACVMLLLVLSNSDEQSSIIRSVKEQINMTQFQTHPKFTTRWFDRSGKPHDVETFRKDGQSRKEWMQDAKADLESSIEEFGPPMDPQPEGK